MDTNSPERFGVLLMMVRNSLRPECLEGWPEAEFALLQEYNSVFAEALAANREAERLRHNVAVEGDFVCPDSIALSDTKKELEETKEKLKNAYKELDEAYKELENAYNML